MGPQGVESSETDSRKSRREITSNPSGFATPVSSLWWWKKTSRRSAKTEDICNFSLDSHIPPFGHCQRHPGFKLNPEQQHQNQHQHQLSFTSTSIPLKYFLSKTCVAKRCSHWYKWTSSYPVMTFSAPGGKFPYWGISFVRTIITSQSPPHSRPTSAYLRKECEQGVSGNSKVHCWQDIP